MSLLSSSRAHELFRCGPKQFGPKTFWGMNGNHAALENLMKHLRITAFDPRELAMLFVG